ncbi:MAG TPA: VOC family protein [Acidimicrobiales bacterium]
MRTLHFGLRVADRERSTAFYEALGYEVVGTVPQTRFGHLSMLMLPGDEFVAIELVHDPAAAPPGPGPNHFVIKVESMAETVADLEAKGVAVDGLGSPDGSEQFLTAWVTDPDGNRIELVQWPPGHPDGLHPSIWADGEG